MSASDLARLRAVNPFPGPRSREDVELFRQITSSPPDPRLHLRARQRRRPAVVLAISLGVMLLLASTAFAISTWVVPSLQHGGVVPASGHGAGHPEVIAVAIHYLGAPHHKNGTSPATGFDSAGFVKYCYAQIGIRLSRHAILHAQAGVRVSMKRLVPGDLVFRGHPASRVGLYAGAGQVIEAPARGAVRYSPITGFTEALRVR